MLFIILVLSVTLYSQETTLSGHIILKDSTIVQGVTIVIKGTSLGSSTDVLGNYRIKKIIPGTYTIRVSLVGHETQERSIVIHKGDNRADFTLTESEIDLNEVVVTGTRSEKMLKSVPVITQVILARRMLDVGITNVAKALETMVPGLNVSQFGNRTAITLQGMDAKYILFLVDGERIAGEVNGDIDYSMLNLDNIDRIEVIKGASSSLYGSNAIGGVINMITKKISDSFDGQFYTRYSNYNELFTGGGLSFKKGILGSSTNFNYSRSDGYDITLDSPHDWTQNPYTTFSLRQKFEVRPAANLLLVPYFGYYQFERGNVSARPVHDFYQDYTGGVRGEYYAGKHSVTFSYHYDRYNTYNVLELLDNQKEVVSYDILQTPRIQGNFHLSDRNNLIAGLEYNYESLYSIRNEGGLRHIGEAVVYLQEDISLSSKWNIIAGVRTSNNSIYGFNVTPKLSLLFRQKYLNFRASLGTGFRSPSLKELYMNFDHFGEWYIIGNPELRPEKSKYLSGSVEFIRPWNNSSLTLYSNTLADMITDRWLPDSTRRTRQYENIASASVNGFDISSKQKVWKGLWLNIGYSFVNSTDNLTGLQLYGTTKHSGHFAVDYTLKEKKYLLFAELYCKMMGEKFYEITEEQTYRDRPFASWRVTVTQEFMFLRITAGIDNIFNLVIPQNIDFISPGRRFFLGLNIDFGKIGRKGN